jgi:glucokinase
VTPVAAAESSAHLGLDLGATNVKWALVERDGDEWSVGDRGQFPTDAADGADAVLDRMADLGLHVLGDHPDTATVGVGLPGLFEASTGIATFLPNLTPDWERRQIVGPLRSRIGLPVTLINDARAFGLAELRLGAGRGCRTMVGLVLGTGVGGVVVVNGDVHFGHDGTGGEVGHQTLHPDGPPCTCGNRGCLEAFARADAVAAACGTATAEEAVSAARAADPRAVAGMAEVGRWLGIGISNLIVVLTPDRVVLGGGVAGAGEFLLEPIRAEVRARVHVTDLDAVDIIRGELGTWAGAIGAAVHGSGVAVPEAAVR